MQRILSLIVILLVLLASCSTKQSTKQYSDDFSKARWVLDEAVQATREEGIGNIAYWDHIELRPLAKLEEAYETSLQAHKNVVQAFDKIRNPPKEYTQAQSKLFEAYGVYLNLHKLVESYSPAHYGTTKGEYEANIRDEAQKYDSIIAQVDALDPTPRR